MMKRILIAFLLCVWVSNAYAVNTVYTNGTDETVREGDTKMCYEYTNRNNTRTAYACGQVFVTNNKCDGISVQYTTVVKQKHGTKLQMPNGSYFCCIKSGNQTGVYVKGDSWEQNKKTETRVVDGKNCKCEVIPDICGGETVKPLDCEEKQENGGGEEPDEDTYSIKFSDTSHRMLEEYKNDEVFMIFECGNNTRCKNKVTKKEEGYKHGSCKVNGEKVEFEDRVFECVYGDNTEYGSFVEQTGDDIPKEDSDSSTDCSSDNKIYSTSKKKCVSKNNYKEISQTDIKKCFACESINDFVTCIRHQCYKTNASDKCTSDLKSACLLK